ncbi:serpin family protein [Nakamurella lactea]|uniref:serpin family protein n=1 Tax=Nakamurella lactea TaxID=459515 RepID=UPI000401385B|nr:serpin family protein [Nakamurella lactea]
MSNPTLLPRRSFLALGAAIGAALLAGCGTEPGSAIPVSSGGASGQQVPDGQEIRGTAARMTAAPADATTENFCRFAAELFTTSVKDQQNAVISPYSVMAALGMAELGADGAALAAMSKVLGGDGAAIAAQVTAIDAAVAAAVAASAKQSSGRQSDPAIVSPANSLFVQKGTPLRTEFLDAVAAGYDSALYSTDYKADPEAARKQINAWVSGKTHELIPELLGAGRVTDRWRLALVNALYFKAQWADELNKATEKTPFTTAAGSTVQVEQLRGGTRHLDYATGDNWQAVSLPYVGGDLAMTILLPAAGAFDAVAKALDGPTLAAACSGGNTPVALTMPGFKTDFGVDLTDPLKALGMGPAFDVPLPGVSDGPEPLEITVVIHQARISVDEHGTEAAAATVVGMEAGAAPGPADPPIEFTVDRPFLYLIHDTTTNCPLFLGQVTDPTS